MSASTNIDFVSRLNPISVTIDLDIATRHHTSFTTSRARILGLVYENKILVVKTIEIYLVTSKNITASTSSNIKLLLLGPKFIASEKIDLSNKSVVSVPSMTDTRLDFMTTSQKTYFSDVLAIKLVEKSYNNSLSSYPFGFELYSKGSINNIPGNTTIKLYQSRNMTFVLY